MNIQSISKNMSKPSRTVFASLLLGALTLAVLASSALAANNLLRNGGFEKDTNGDGVPNGWTRLYTVPSHKQVCNQSYAGACSFKFGQATYNYLYQNISVNGLAGDEFTLSLWAKTKDLVVGGGSYYYSIEIFHTDNISSDTSGAGLNAGTTGWSKHQNGLVASESYDEIQVIIFFNPDSGKAWFDKVKLVGP